MPGSSAIGFTTILEIVDMLDEQYEWPDWVFSVSFFTAIGGVTEVVILAWFHGEKGKQEMSILEWVLVSVIGVIWPSRARIDNSKDARVHWPPVSFEASPGRRTH
ncbi:MAG: hypothetical protein OSA81_07660 [Longimicrobiales bacterium]|nr:hypothetical protein [Longimicrobiales bacterium]